MSSLSVVIPTRNRAPLLQRAAASALDGGAEVIVIDDASTDSTPCLLRTLPGIRFERLAERRGPCFARNLGLSLAHGELVLFLDDDDYLLPGANDAIQEAIRRSPDVPLHFHNCRYPDGATSTPDDLGLVSYSYEDWLRGKFKGELKPVVRRDLFDHYSLPDTGAGGEGLLWGRVIRDRGAIVSGVAIIAYNDAAGPGRLTSPLGLLEHAAENAGIAEEWLQSFGEDLRGLDEKRWTTRVLAAATFQMLARNRSRALELFDSIPDSLLAGPKRSALRLALRSPRPLGRLLFLGYRRGRDAAVKRRRQNASGAAPRSA